MDDVTPAPSPLLKACVFIARWSLALMLFAWFLFAAGWGALHLLIVPRIGELRAQIEATASHMLGVPVHIRGVAAYSTGILPAFELIDVSLQDEQGREALRLPRVLVSLSPRSMLGLKFDQVYIDRPTLDVRRALDGKVYVAGLDLSTGRTDDGVMDQLFSQPEFVIRHGSVVWSDELRGAPPLALRDVDLVLRNRGRRHDMRLDATPPVRWGERFALVARFEQPFLSMRSGRWQEWAGQVYANFNRIDVAELKRYADLKIDLRQGRGAVRAWADVRRAQLTAGTADVALADVEVKLDAALAPLRIKSVSGRLDGRISPGLIEFSTRRLEFDTADGLRWPGGNFQIVQSDGDASRPSRGELTADRLDLAALTQIAGRIPLDAALHAALLQHAPTGLVERVKAKWQGSNGRIEKYEVQARVRQLTVQARPAATTDAQGSMVIGSPGISGATLELELTESAGKARVELQNGSLSIPGVFEDPVIPLAHLSSDLAWQLDGDKIQVQLSNTRFGNADADGDLQLEWHTSDPGKSSGGARFPGVLDLQGKLSRAEASRVYRYLPLILHQQVRDYVRDAVQGGQGSAVKFKVKGDLHDMPFASPGQGEFLITAAIRNAAFAYVPRRYQTSAALPWPALHQLSGELTFERRSLQVKGVRGSVVGLPGLQITRADGGIADLAHAASVAFSLDARGPLSDLLTVVNTSPLNVLTGNALVSATASGNAELRLKASLPLDALDKSTVQGTVALAGNDILFAAQTPRLARARGTVAFSEAGFSLNGFQARMLGGDVRLDGGTVPVAAPSGAAGALAPLGAASVSLRAQGVASAEALRQARELGWVSRLARYASGSTAYAAVLTLRAGVPEFLLSSNLAGLALSLPTPLNKSADATLPLRVESALVRDPLLAGPAGRVRLQDQLALDLGRIGSVTYVRDISGTEPRVVRGAIAVGLARDESAPLPDAGVLANINMDSVDLDAWGEVLSQVSGTGSNGTGSTEAGSGATTAERSYLPTSAVLRARELMAGGRKLRNVVVGGSREGQTWRANVDADELDGYVEYRQPVASGAGRVFARLSRLTLAQTSASDVETLLDEQPATIPALDVVVEDVELRGKKLGRVEIEAVNRGAAAVARDGGVREWRLNKFDIITPEAVLKATGSWAALNAQSPTTARPGAGPAGRSERLRTVMNFKLDIRSSGELLTRFGMKDVVRRGKGTMEGQVAWVGSPLALDYPSLSGAFNVNIENGQFLKADPGLAKLLGVLSLQSLPRRLALDFRDVFTEGFAFDFLRGDVKIDRGIASSNNLQMKGVNAAVLMDGKADLSRETQDIRVVVVPEINAGTASLIATAINPAIGLGSFLAQLFLRRPLMEAATQEFHVDGSWIEPRIARVGRRTGAAGAADENSPTGTDRKTGETQ